MIRLVALLCVLIVVIDTVESVIAKASGTPYAWFMLVQIFVYFGIGFVLRRRAVPLTRVLIAVALTALVEATLGEAVAVGIGATPAVPLAQMVFVIPIVLVFESALAMLGFAIGSIRTTARS